MVTGWTSARSSPAGFDRRVFWEILACVSRKRFGPVGRRNAAARTPLQRLRRFRGSSLRACYGRPRGGRGSVTGGVGLFVVVSACRKTVANGTGLTTVARHLRCAVLGGASARRW